MKRVICIPFAFVDEYESGANIKGKNRLKIYMKNVAVALASAKYYNPDCDIVFATNISRDNVPVTVLNVIDNLHIKIMNVPFDCYVFHSNYKWALAFYKLCVLRNLIQIGFDYCCYLDSDVYVQSSFDAIWEECKNRILLFDINHGLNVKEYQEIIREICDFTGENVLVTHYGGEFFASNYENAVLFEKELYDVYKRMLQDKFVTTKGDEFIISIAAERLKSKIKNASPYINRFWTGASFRLMSTNYLFNPVLILHMPAEKEKGIIKLYDKFIAKNRIPSNRDVWRICRLKHLNFVDWLFMKVIDLKRR